MIGGILLVGVVYVLGWAWGAVSAIASIAVAAVFYDTHSIGLSVLCGGIAFVLGIALIASLIDGRGQVYYSRRLPPRIRQRRTDEDPPGKEPPRSDAAG